MYSVPMIGKDISAPAAHSLCKVTIRAVLFILEILTQSRWQIYKLRKQQFGTYRFIGFVKKLFVLPMPVSLGLAALSKNNSAGFAFFLFLPIRKYSFLNLT